MDRENQGFCQGVRKFMVANIELLYMWKQTEKFLLSVNRQEIRKVASILV